MGWWLEDDPALEYRYWVAQKLRPNSGLYDYHYGTDAIFCDRIDSDWMQWVAILERPFIKAREVKVTNL